MSTRPQPYRADLAAKLGEFVETLRAVDEWPELVCPKCGTKLTTYFGRWSKTWRAMHRSTSRLPDGTFCALENAVWAGGPDRAEFWKGYAQLAPLQGSRELMASIYAHNMRLVGKVVRAADAKRRKESK